MYYIVWIFANVIPLFFKTETFTFKSKTSTDLDIYTEIRSTIWLCWFRTVVFKSCYKTVLKHGLTTTLLPEYELSSYTSRLIMISRWLIMSEHFVKSDCLRLEKIETSYCNLHVKSFALFRSFLYPWVVSLRPLIKYMRKSRNFHAGLSGACSDKFSSCS